MTITREQLADLQPGDVVELRGYPSLKDAVVSGPLWSDGETKKLCVGPFVIRHRDGDAPIQYDDEPDFTLTVVSRAPRPLYVNHPRTEPVPGDVVRDADDEARSRVWTHLPHFSFAREAWVTQSGNQPIRRGRSALPARLRLLVDGENGQVVP